MWQNWQPLKNGTARIVSVTGAPSIEEVKANVEAKPYKCEPNFDLANQMEGVKIAFDIWGNYKKKLASLISDGGLRAAICVIISFILSSMLAL